MRKLHAFLCEIARKMKKYRFPRMLLRVSKGIGLTRLVHYLFSLCFKISTYKQGKDEKLFFSEHAQELKVAYDSLADERSRSVFENILKYRVTAKRVYLKESTGEDNPETQYFTPELHFSNHEIIVDCGAYYGDTVKLFYEKISGCRVVALEPDETNFKLLQEIKLAEFKPIKCGAWSEDTTLSFSDKGGGTIFGKIDISGSTKIEVKALDNLLECQSATYIKMDIEGAELEALKGAEKIIKKNRPKLAICIYHKPQDFFEIPLYIKKTNPDYKLYIHHHQPGSKTETVLYAV